MIHTHVLKNGHVASQAGLIDHREAHVWVEVVAPTPEEVTQLTSQLGIDELALRSALWAGGLPRYAEYAGDVLIHVSTPLADQERGGEDLMRRLAILVGQTRLVTVLRRPFAALQHAMRNLRERQPQRLADSDLLAYSLVEKMTEGFSGLVDALAERVESLEDDLETGTTRELTSRILELRRDVMQIERITRRQRDVCAAVANGQHSAIAKRSRLHFRDQQDALARIHEQMEAIREDLAGIREAHLAQVSNRLGGTMRVLTVITTIMMPLTLVAGIYGMNLTWLPLANHPAGLWVILGVMFVLAAGMLSWFRRRDWI